MHKLLVITGPTGVGKTELTLRLAESLGCEIVNADSRQIYREIPIGTAAPTAEEQARVKHWFVGTKSVTENYSAGDYERDCLAVLGQLGERAILSGGSMLYIDAVCNGLDDIPKVDEALRQQVRNDYEQKGLRRSCSRRAAGGTKGCWGSADVLQKGCRPRPRARGTR